MEARVANFVRLPTPAHAVLKRSTTRHLGGFWVIEAKDLDAAQEWAAKASKACFARIEVRPFEAS